MIGYWKGNRPIWQYKDIHIWFWTDKGKYLNGLQYKFVNDICWTLTKPKEFYNKFCNNNLEFIIHSFRKYGQPKLAKPKELKGIKQAFSIEYMTKKCKCPVFIKDDDVWIKHRDYFSPAMKVNFEDTGTSLNYRANKYLGKNINSKFLYDDTWGEIVERQEAWIVIKNLIKEIKSGKFQLDIVKDILRQQEKIHRFDEYELDSSDMARFWEKLVMELYNNTKL